MCLGRVYIVLEPIGSARLTFDDDLNYELCVFDDRSLFGVPGRDHGRDKESQNGRDIKIDILEGYIRTSKWFRRSLGIFRSTGRLPEPPGELLGLSGL